MTLRAETSDDEFGNNLVRFSVLIQRRYARICADHDMTTVQATLLCVLKAQPQGMGELADELGITKNALSGLVDRMERRGLVHRANSPRDRRAVTVDITELGAKVVGGLWADVAARLPDVTDCVPARDLSELRYTIALVTGRVAVERV